MYTIKEHTLIQAKQVPTTKQGKTMVPKFIVMHYTAGWTTEGDVFTLSKSSRPASVHLVLSREGEFTQIVPFDRVAWHAGPSSCHGFTGLNNHSIGIEICNIGRVKQLSNGTYQDIYGKILDDPKIKNWHHEAHPRAGSGIFAWEPYAEKQLEALDVMVELLITTYPSIRWIVSHEEIDTRGWKTDPGPAFPMRRYTRLLDDRRTDGEFRTKTKARVNLRGGPGTEYGIIRELAVGERVQVLDRREVWRFVKTKSEKGWVHSYYLVDGS